MLAAVGAVGAASQADAALYYWQDFDPSYYRPPFLQPRRQKVRRPHAKPAAVPKDTASKPQGPLIISVSIHQQRVQVYDANGLFAESLISTGMAGHPTPMGVFSVIQKQRYHRSNIYSGAPMPYMQRITWSGIALHAGVLPGYPASHGCIRMPAGFAIKMWNWTRMGARVIVMPNEVTPASFSHPLLVTQRAVPPSAPEASTYETPVGVKHDKGADAGSPAQPSPSHANLDLRSSVGHTADTSGTLTAASAAAAITDAAAAALKQTTGARSGEAKSGRTPGQMTIGEVKSAETGRTAKTSETLVLAQAAAEPVKTDASANKLDEAAKGSAAATSATPVTATDSPAATTDTKKDPARLSGLTPPKRTGQIAAFISRKDSKLYVRQNFSPLFEVPITIAEPDRPFGTHIFTAEADKNDRNVLRWSVVSLPVIARNAARIDDEFPQRRRRMTAVPVEAKPVQTTSAPAEALDRLTIPPDAMARINEALTTGGSIIVSDQGVNQGGETGEGTDFIVRLRY